MSQQISELDNISLMTEFIIVFNAISAIRVYDDGDKTHVDLLSKLKLVRAELAKRNL